MLLTRTTSVSRGHSQLPSSARGALLALLTLTFAPALLRAQGHPRKQDIVVVALADEQTVPDGSALILRNTGGEQRNIIVLRKSLATSGRLQSAMQILVSARLKHGDSTKHITRMLVHDRREVESSDAATRALFDKLLRASPYPVAGVGEVPAISVVLEKKP